MNNYQRHDTAQQLADTQSPYYMAKLLIEEREQTASLLNLVADIRAAAGDAGRLMQDELVDHIAGLRKAVEALEAQLAERHTPSTQAGLATELLAALIQLRTDLRKTGGCIDTTTLGRMQRAIVAAGGGE